MLKQPLANNAYKRLHCAGFVLQQNLNDIGLTLFDRASKRRPLQRLQILESKKPPYRLSEAYAISQSCKMAKPYLLQSGWRGIEETPS